MELFEYVQPAAALPVDRENAVIRGVKILGAHSKNKREYLAEAIRSAIPLYEGARVNVNHAAKGKENEVRGYEEQLGDFRAVAYRENDGLYGDFHFNPKHPLAEQMMWDAEHAPHRLGMSHVVEGKTSYRGGSLIVEAIAKVKSIDLVTKPATTSGLYEHEEPIQESTMNLDELKAKHPDLVAELKSSILAEHADSEAAKNHDAEFQKLREEVETLRAKEQARLVESEIDALLEEHKLSVKDSFRALLRDANDSDRRKSMVADLKEQIEEARKPVPKAPQSRDRLQESQNGAALSDVKSFVAGIKG